MKKIVIESEINITEDVDVEDSGCAVILHTGDPKRDDDDQLVGVRIISWDETQKHSEMKDILNCKKIRITIEEMEESI